MKELFKNNFVKLFARQGFDRFEAQTKTRLRDYKLENKLSKQFNLKIRYKLIQCQNQNLHLIKTQEC